MKIYDHTYQDEEGFFGAVEQANGLCWQEIECTEEEKPAHSEYCGTANGIDIYYCYGADHWFFVDPD